MENVKRFLIGLILVMYVNLLINHVSTINRRNQASEVAQTLIHVQFQTMDELRAQINELEKQLYAESIAYDKIIDSFMDNWDSVAEFLGMQDFYIEEKDIVLQGNFVTANIDLVREWGNSTVHNRVQAIFRYFLQGDEIRWVFLEYNIGPISGPGFLHSGRPFWQHQQEEQEELFAESFVMQIYRGYDWNPDFMYNIIEVEISPQDWRAQVKYNMNYYLNIQLADLWYEENRLVVDLTPATAIPFDWGSTGGAVRSFSLFNSMASLPNVTDVEVLVGGQRGVSGSHFCFARVFRAAND